MTRFKRFIGLAVLGAFLGLTAAETIHVHKELGAPANHCAVCKIAHQTPVLTYAASVIAVPMSMLYRIAEPPASSHFAFDATAHGLSPPLL